MSWNGVSTPVALTPITVAFFVTNVKENLEDHQLRLVALEDLFPLTNASMAAGMAVANLGYTPVNKAGDSMSGGLSISGDGSGVTFNSGGKVADYASLGGTGIQAAGNVLDVRTADFNNSILRAAFADAAPTFKGSTMWHAGNDGSGSGLDADTVDGNQASALVARSNHTGTQAPGSISPQGSGSGLDADTVDGNHASAFATSGHTHSYLPLETSQSDSDAQYTLTTSYAATDAAVTVGVGTWLIVGKATATQISGDGYISLDIHNGLASLDDTRAHAVSGFIPMTVVALVAPIGSTTYTLRAKKDSGSFSSELNEVKIVAFRVG